MKSQVEAQWRDDEVASRLKAKAADILDKLKNGGTLEAMAAANGVKVETATDITRTKPPETISARMIDAIFHTALDAYASAEGDKPTQWIVFRVTDVKTPSLDKNTPERQAARRDDQSRQVGDDVFGQYMAWLESDLGTSVNQSALPAGLGQQRRRIPIECRSSLRRKSSPPAMRPASRRWYGRRWSPTWKRRSPHS